MKANQAFKTAPQGFGNMGGAIGGTIGFTIGIVVVLVLLPTVQDQAKTAKDSPNATSAEKGLVGLYPLVFTALPLASAAAGAGVGAAYKKN